MQKMATNSKPREKKHEREYGQIDDRWKTFELTQTVPLNKRIVDIPDCIHCFATMAYLGDDYIFS